MPELNRTKWQKFLDGCKAFFKALWKGLTWVFTKLSELYHKNPRFKKIVDDTTEKVVDVAEKEINKAIDKATGKEPEKK